MKKLFLLFALFIALFTNAQNPKAILNEGGFGAGVYSSGTISTKSLLDIRSTTKGVLFPRMTTANFNAITSPEISLFGYNLSTGRFRYYNGSSWVELYDSAWNIQRVLDTGFIANGDNGSVTMDLDSGTFNFSAGENATQRSTLSLADDALSLGNDTGTQIGEFNVYSGKYQLRQTSADGSVETTVSSELPTNNVNYIFKAQPVDGDYYVAVSGDIAGLLTTSITNGDTTHAPNGDVIFDTFALRPNVTLSGEAYLSLTGQAITVNPVNVAGTNITGVLKAASFPPQTGDVTNPSGSLANTISTGAVTSGKILDATILNADINANAAIDATKLIDGSVSNTELGFINTLTSDAQTQINSKQATLVSATTIKTLETLSLLGSGNIDLSKTDVGLGNVDNTSDLNKPISTAQQTALDAKEIKLTITALKTANYSVQANEFVPVDTTSGSIILTLPTTPADGTQCGAKMSVLGGSNTITLNTGGSDVINVTGGSTSGTLSVLNQVVIFQYKSSVGIWYALDTSISKTYIDAQDALKSPLAGSASLTTTGTIVTGVWNATAIGAQYGGTGLNTSASTGIPQILSGVWSVSTGLANGTTATTQSQADSSTKVATTAYVDTGLATKQASLTISTGLTNTSNTITNNLSTGVSGGQSIIGGTGSTDNLTIQSTSNATKSNIYINPLAASATKGSVTFGSNISNPLPISGDPDHQVLIVNDNTGMQVFRMLTVGSTGLGGQNNFHCDRARGTIASPSAIQSGDFFLSMGFRGYDGSAMSQSAAALQFKSSVNWTTGLHGTMFNLELTPNTGTTRVPVFQAYGDGRVFLTKQAAWTPFQTTSILNFDFTSSGYSTLNNIFLASGNTTNGIGFQMGVDATNSLFAYRYPSGQAGNYTGTNYAFANTFGIESGSTTNQGIHIAGSEVVIGSGRTSTNGNLRVDAVGVRIGTNADAGTAATARLTISAGTATAGTAPFKGTAGVLLTVPEALADEYSASSKYSTTVALNRYADGGKIYGTTTDVSNTSTTETDIMTYTTKASTLSATDESLVLDLAGTFNDVTATADLKFYFGGTSIGDTGVLTVSATGGWTARIVIVRSGSTTAKAMLTVTTPGASTAQYTTVTSLTGLTFTGTNILKCTGTAGGASGGTGDITASVGQLLWWGASAN